MDQLKFRLVTRSDFDGLVCAILFREMDMIDDIRFVHPKDMQDGKIEITERDITTNLPYVKNAHMVFDHHLSETIRNTGLRANHIIDPDAPSAARVVYDHFGGIKAFPKVSLEMMEAVDKADSAQYSVDDILNPKGWVLLNYLMDSRTGLGRFREFKISNYALMMSFIKLCQTHTVEQVLEMPDVKERLQLYFEHSERAKDQIKRCTEIHENLAVLDLRNEEITWATNRFMIYALFPDINISIHLMWGLQKQNTVFATGKSILNRTSKTNIGALMLHYGGGGHPAAGTCQIENDRAPTILQDLIKRINSDG
ncbi:MAG: exopolyphosphatase [Holophagales bacterium]|jgi:nanoRNase/pAp phosphatase (c-di-AMP/oligoRNAs hydrolase)|nr:exopolyphosphatase [Holophagales bacterium]